MFNLLMNTYTFKSYLNFEQIMGMLFSIVRVLQLFNIRSCTLIILKFFTKIIDFIVFVERLILLIWIDRRYDIFAAYKSDVALGPLVFNERSKWRINIPNIVTVSL